MVMDANRPKGVGRSTNDIGDSGLGQLLSGERVYISGNGKIVLTILQHAA
jgi:hypothetical protein